jgi:uncharacterized protein
MVVGVDRATRRIRDGQRGRHTAWPEEWLDEMHDPREGVTPDGLIRTGASREAIDPTWTPVLQAAVDAVNGRGSLYVYGSVATGGAVVPASDVDLLSVGLPVREAARIGAHLSSRYSDRCREVSVAPASWTDLEAASDEGYGFRVFLRHYCVHLAGADPADGLPAYPADRRAARGFNGDIAQHLQRWRFAADTGPDVAGLATRIARKTLLAVAGLVSMRDATWSTDRRTCARRWNELEPGAPVDALVGWLETPSSDRAAIHHAVGGSVAQVVRSFRSEIGLWDSRGSELPADPPGASIP